MTLLFAAFGATIAALVEATIVRYVRVGESQPHLVFVFAVIVTVVGGFDRGLVWAFVGGLFLDVLTQRPLGISAFALLLSVGGVAVLGRLLPRIRPLLPILAVLLLSLVYSMTVYATYSALRGPAPSAEGIDLLLPNTVYDLVLAALFGPLIVAFADRRADADRVEW